MNMNKLYIQYQQSACMLIWSVNININKCINKYIELGYCIVYNINIIHYVEVSILHPSPTLVDINTSIYQEAFWFYYFCCYFRLSDSIDILLWLFIIEIRLRFILYLFRGIGLFLDFILTILLLSYFILSFT